jgi:hypothetical protein
MFDADSVAAVAADVIDCVVHVALSGLLLLIFYWLLSKRRRILIYLAVYGSIKIL